jgi:succinyl-diaminopimelate desuccinylase
VVSDAGDPCIADVLDAATEVLSTPARPQALSYFTDASALVPALGGPPAVICGPGDPRQAHVTDEHCSIAALEASVDLLTEVVRRWTAPPLSGGKAA